MSAVIDGLSIRELADKHHVHRPRCDRRWRARSFRRGRDQGAFWAAAREALGDSTGTQVMVEVLLLHRHLKHVDVLAGSPPR